MAGVGASTTDRLQTHRTASVLHRANALTFTLALNPVTDTCE